MIQSPSRGIPPPKMLREPLDDAALAAAQRI
jgi:hypothetical protein